MSASRVRAATTALCAGVLCVGTATVLPGVLALAASAALAGVLVSAVLAPQPHADRHRPVG